MCRKVLRDWKVNEPATFGLSVFREGPIQFRMREIGFSDGTKFSWGCKPNSLGWKLYCAVVAALTKLHRIHFTHFPSAHIVKDHKRCNVGPS